MASYREEDIKHETENFFVLEEGAKGYEVYRKGITHATRVASIGHGPAPQLGLTRAREECARREGLLGNRMYHLVLVDKPEVKATAYPDTHQHCMTIKSKTMRPNDWTVEQVYP